jgi:uncharacterized membrane protein YedE/YeeE
MIDWHNFTPWTSLLGGLIIGLAAAVLILFNGRIAGVSGILSGLIKPRLHEINWRVAFILGIILAPICWRMFAPLPASLIEASDTLIVVAGLLVGLGTRFGAGCTSGHGICGISRLSPRSMVATVTFIMVGFITVYVVRHLMGAY